MNNDKPIMHDEPTYPTRCRIIDVTGVEVFPGIKGRTPDESKPHIGKEGLAEEARGGVRITLDDSTILWGCECWWEPIEERTVNNDDPTEEPEMELPRMKFRLSSSCCYWWDLLNVRRSDKAGVCESFWYSLFHLPRKLRRLDLVLYALPGVDRVKVRVGLGWDGPKECPFLSVVEVGLPEISFSGPEFDRFLKPLIGKTVYIGVEYDE